VLNALQITAPNAGNPLAQAPSWADAAQSVTGAVGSGVDLLTQWLSEQRAKNAQRRGSVQLAGDVVPFPELPKIMQDDAPFAPDKRMRNTLYPPLGPQHDYQNYPYYVTPYGPPANDASIPSAILRG
jgi:hypothetical protein